MTDHPKHWTLDDIPWDNFDASKVDPEMLRIVKGAALVEHNGGIYAEYLSSVFHDDPEFQQAAKRWGSEEVQHGEALARWAKLADPEFDFDKRFADFSAKIVLPTSADQSVRGSRCGELVARCMVEVGTSSYYTALREATDEPVLREICRNIAQDEIRHYKLFYTHMARYREVEKLGVIRRILVGISRISESEDYELAYAYYAANTMGEPYNRKKCVRAYTSRAFGFYRPHHVERGIILIFKAVGLKPHARLASWAAKQACWFLNLKSGQRISAAH
ncbi:MAG: ferritin-like domain-containing protein [Sphingomonadaceae bacterium]|nr:MAG: ferritin-like domain-containing protein [Sphingomonadaceae bacterium]